MLHRARDLSMRQRTQLIDELCGRIWRSSALWLLRGVKGSRSAEDHRHEQDARLPVDGLTSLVVLAGGLQALQTMIRSIERQIIAQHRSDEASKRLRSIPGIGIVGATAIAATVPDPRSFDRVVTLRPGSGSYHGRIPPAANRSSGRFRKQGDQYRDASGLLEPMRCRSGRATNRRVSVGHTTLERRPFRVVAVAVATAARVAWALLARGGSYRAPALAAAA